MSEEVIYKGHGQIEIYPINTVIIGILSHELRHANFNRYLALLKNKDVKQDVKITLSYENGKLYPSKAYTEARFSERLKKDELLLKLIFLKIKISKLKKEGKDFEVKKYEEKLRDLQKKFFKEDLISNLYKIKKDHAQLIGFFRDIYFYQKFNLPPVSLNAPFFKDAADVKKKLDEIYRKNIDNYEFQFKSIENIDDSFINSKIFAYKKVYKFSENFFSYLENFNLPLKKAENNYNDYFSIIPDDNARNGNYTVNIKKLPKSFIVYSKKFYDIFEPLNLQGNPKINGVEVNISSSDSLYDIMEKINWGEDVNHNFQLDEGEDLNENNKLDGGTKEHGVFAYIENDRLYLKNVLTGNIKIIIDDDNNVFHSLGIIAENPLNNETYFPNILQNGEDAEISINGKELKSHTDIFVYNSLTVRVKKKIENATFKITDNDEEIFNKIKEFVSNYNSIIGLINNYLSEGNELENDLGLLLIKRGMKLAFFHDYYKVSEKGIDIKLDKNYIKELEILGINKDNSKKFNESIVNKLYSIGIKSKEDETIIIDEKLLKESIKKEKVQLKKLFFSKNGIIENLKNFLNKVLNEDYGIIKVEISNTTSEGIKKIEKNLLKEKGNFSYFVERLKYISGLIGNEK